MKALIIALLAVAILGSSAVPAGAAVRDCNNWVHYPNTRISSARNMSCASAKKDLKAHDGPISYSFRTPGGFKCTRVSGGELGGQWRCKKASKAYRFDFGD